MEAASCEVQALAIMEPVPFAYFHVLKLLLMVVRLLLYRHLTMVVL